VREAEALEGHGAGYDAADDDGGGGGSTCSWCPSAALWVRCIVPTGGVVLLVPSALIGWRGDEEAQVAWRRRVGGVWEEGGGRREECLGGSFGACASLVRCSTLLYPLRRDALVAVESASSKCNR
jgi:hypothetical protein